MKYRVCSNLMSLAAAVLMVSAMQVGSATAAAVRGNFKTPETQAGEQAIDVLQKSLSVNARFLPEGVCGNAKAGWLVDVQVPLATGQSVVKQYLVSTDQMYYADGADEFTGCQVR